MPKYRLNTVTGRWAIVAEPRDERAAKPTDFFPLRIKTFPPGRKCPFCPPRKPEEIPLWAPKGQERKKTHTGLYAIKRKGGELALVNDPLDWTDDWSLFVKRNLYPFLEPIAFPLKVPDIPAGAKPYRWNEGVGECDVVIETSKHDRPIGLLDETECYDIVRAWHACYARLAKEGAITHIAIFGNHGRDAGASLEHPHSQIVATTGIVPADVKREFDNTEWRFNQVDHECAMCLMIRNELPSGDRLVRDTKPKSGNEGFIIFEPYGSEYPFETWIVPKRHSSSFKDCSTVEMQELGAALSWTFGRLRVCLDDVSYNYVLCSTLRPTEILQQCYHWYVRIEPRGLITTGGFEEGSGLRVNLLAPEVAAEWLRRRGNSLSLDTGTILKRRSTEITSAVEIIERDGDPRTDEQENVLVAARRLKNAKG